MRLRDEVTGAMNPLDTEVGALDPQDLAAAQALCDVATIGILAERGSQQRDLVASQLQHPLDSRVVIEQAEGILARLASIDMDGAFSALRAFARINNMPLRTVAAALADRSLDISRVVRPRFSTARPGRR